MRHQCSKILWWLPGKPQCRDHGKYFADNRWLCYRHIFPEIIDKASKEEEFRWDLKQKNS